VASCRIVAAISQPEIDTGQDITLALHINATDAQTDDLVLTSIAQAIDDNTEYPQDKRGLVALATLLLCLGFALGGIAQLLPSFLETVEHLAH
jgi:hypothetical protein